MRPLAPVMSIVLSMNSSLPGIRYVEQDAIDVCDLSRCSFLGFKLVLARPSGQPHWLALATWCAKEASFAKRRRLLKRLPAKMLFDGPAVGEFIAANQKTA